MNSFGTTILLAWCDLASYRSSLTLRENSMLLRQPPTVRRPFDLIE